MAEKTPIRLVFTSGTPTGIAEYQSGDTIGNSFLTNPNFTLVDDSSTSTTISLGETLKITGTGGITTSLSGDVLSISVDGSIVTESSADTLTNKTISGSSNTLSDIGNSSLTNSTITVDGDSGSQAIDLGDTLTISGDTGITTSVSGDSISIDLDDTAVTPGSYGSTTAIPVITVDQQGRLTNVSTSNISTVLTVVDDSSTSASINLLNDTLKISGTSNEIETSISGDTLSIGLPNNVTIGNNLSVTGNATISGDLTVNGTTTTVNSSTIEITNSFTFEGSTADAYETVLGVVDPTADRTINLPDATGTVVLKDTTDTLTNKTINSASNTITITESNISDLQSYILADSTDTLTNKTFDANGTGNSISNIEVADFASGVVDTDLSSVSANDDTLASAKAIKTYVDSQVTAQDLDFQGDSGGALSIDLDSESLTIAGGTGIDTSGSGNTLTVAIDSSVTTNTGSQTLTNKVIDTASNTITVVEADISDLQSYILADSTDTLTNKTINLTSNTLSGTTAEFNTALSDGSFATLAGSETLTNKTLTTPVISSISNTGTLTLPTSSDTLVGRDTTDTLTNKTINSASNTITITESNISDLGAYITASSTDTLTNKSGNISQWTNDSGYLTTETNDLTSAVTWANIPDANVPQSAVTQHQAALSITESQISDLGAYITASSTDTLTNKTINGSQLVDGSVANVKLTNSSITVSDGSNSTATSLGGTITFSGTANEIEVGESSGTITIGLPNDVTIGNNLTVTGDLTVNGTTTTVNSTTLTVDDKNIELGSTASPTDTSADGGGITLKGTTDKTFNWVDSTDSWTSSEHLDLATGKEFKINSSTVLTSSQVLGKSLPSGDVIGTSDTQTLTNKTISGSSNTLSNIDNASLTNSTITVSGDSGSQAIDLGDTLSVNGDTGITTTVSGDTISIDLDDTAVTPGSYGSATEIPTFTVDQQGRMTAVGIANVASSLTIVDDSSTSATISLLNDTLKIGGTSNEIETSISGDNLIIGLPDDVTVGNDLTVSNDLSVTGATVLKGNVTIGQNTGDSTEDSITVNGRFVSNLEPMATVTYDLGSPNRRWRDLYLSGNTIDLAGATISGDGTGSITISASGAILPQGSKIGSDTIASADASGAAVRNVPFYTNSGGLVTAAKNFKFSAGSNATVFQSNQTFTLANGFNTQTLALFVF